MRLLITGATGRVGSRYVRRMLQRGDELRLLVRQPEQAESLRQMGAEVAVGDLSVPETLDRAVAGMDAVVHLAAFFRGATPAQVQAVNLDGTVNLAHAALEAGVSRFIFSSTTLVYGPGRGRPRVRVTSRSRLVRTPRVRWQQKRRCWRCTARKGSTCGSSGWRLFTGRVIRI